MFGRYGMYGMLGLRRHIVCSGVGQSTYSSPVRSMFMVRRELRHLLVIHDSRLGAGRNGEMRWQGIRTVNFKGAEACEACEAGAWLGVRHVISWKPCVPAPSMGSGIKVSGAYFGCPGTLTEY
jgi:hypothetical protein